MTRALLLLVAALAGCSGSGEPSQADLRAALAQSGNRGAAQAEKLACKSSPERPGYACDYRAPACNRFTGTCGDPRPFSGRFLHAGGRWQLVEDLTPRAQPDPVTQPLPGIAVASPDLTAPVVTPLPSPRPVAAPPPAEPPQNGYDPDDDDFSSGDRRRISEWVGLDARCRAGADDDRYTERTCRRRDRAARKLERRGLCHVAPGGWRRCD